MNNHERHCACGNTYFNDNPYCPGCVFTALRDGREELPKLIAAARAVLDADGDTTGTLRVENALVDLYDALWHAEEIQARIEQVLTPSNAEKVA